MSERVNMRDLHFLTWSAECVRAGEQHHHQCGRCALWHEPTAEEAALIYKAAQRPGDACCLDNQGNLIPAKVQQHYGMTVVQFLAAFGSAEFE
jgi:hypothetical protein